MNIKIAVLLQDNLRLGKKLATGGFGTVFKADLTDDEDPNDVRSVIVKKVLFIYSLRLLRSVEALDLGTVLPNAQLEQVYNCFIVVPHQQPSRMVCEPSAMCRRRSSERRRCG